MESISKADCTQIGFFRKTHGVHGEFILEYDPEYELSISKSDRFFVEMEGLLVPYFVSEDGLRIKSSKSAIVKIDWVNTEDDARRMIGNTVWLFSNEIIFEEVEFQESNFLGFVLVDEERGEIGKIISIDDFSGNVVFTLIRKGREILIPYNEHFLISCNESKKIITMQLPEGLLEQ